MNAYVGRYLAQHRLNTEGDGFYGTMLGYDLSGSYQQIFYSTITVWAHLEQTGREAVQTWIRGVKKRFSISSFEITAHFVRLNMPPLRCTPIQFTTAIGELIGFLGNLGVRTDSCPVCGEPLDESACTIVSDGARARVHEPCLDRLRREQRLREEREEALPDITAFCILAALAGALVVGLVWSVAFVISYFSVVLAVLIPVAAAFLWDKAGGSNGVGKIVTLWGVSILCFFALGLCSYAIALWIELSAYGTYGFAAALDIILYSLAATPSALVQICVLFGLNFVGVLASGSVLTARTLSLRKQRGLRKL